MQANLVTSRDSSVIRFIERKGAFVTAQELAAYGVEKVLKEFPYGGQGSTNRG